MILLADTTKKALEKGDSAICTNKVLSQLICKMKLSSTAKGSKDSKDHTRVEGSPTFTLTIPYCILKHQSYRNEMRAKDRANKLMTSTKNLRHSIC